ncbi:DUF6090 family protein [Psychroserpens sp. AS72]|uniref:DUF6090 family protein n=1 Tax=Psychroserpens sp. AS72 TaxID=3135775 RepID=UPI0031783DCB
MENKTSKPALPAGRYFKYAIGEIILVVIGILIALQINTWQQHKKDKALEKRYLKNLVQELKKDSLALHINSQKLKRQADTKNPLLDMLREGKETDSLNLFFNLQWRPIYAYTPLKSTYEEMTNSSHLNIIQSDEIRSAIVKMYNSYEDLEKDEDFLLEYFKNLVNELSKKVASIYNPSVDDILALGNDKYIMNSIRLNGAYSRLNNYNEKLAECSQLLQQIKNYQDTLK